MFKFTVDRTKWLRGAVAERGGKSLLLRTADGKRDIVGIMAKACGIEDNVIADKPTLLCIYTSVEELSNIPEPLSLLVATVSPLRGFLASSNKYLVNSSFGQDLMALNDVGELTQEAREGEITTLLATRKIEVEFIN